MEFTPSDTITIEVLINASTEQVWNAWTNPLIVLKWFGSDPNGKGLKAELDVRPGGRFEITFENADRTQHTCFGVYTEVQRFNKLSFTWTWKSEPGVESFVTVLLAPVNNMTKVTFEHANVGTLSSHDYLAGWKRTFERLEQTLKQK